MAWLLIPLISGLIGWLTNWVAVKMTFYPLEFWGRPPYLGWQGIIPRKAEKMAALSIDRITERALRIEDLLARLDPHEMAELLRPRMAVLAERVVDSIMADEAPTMWEALPRRAKRRVYTRLQAILPSALADVIGEIRRHPDETLDVRRLFIDTLVRHKALLNRLFQECGAEEFPFIERSGLVFGGLFGLVQALVWSLLGAEWILPFGGFVIGYATNWLALKMIFEPHEPRRYGPVTWQGLFLRRQEEVSRAYARLVAREILDGGALLEGLMRGRRRAALEEILRGHLQRALEPSLGAGAVLLRRVLGKDRWQAVQRRVLDDLIAQVPLVARRLDAYAQETLAIEEELRRRMVALPPAEFEDFLRPVFREDEFTLILVGGALGLVAGLLQLMIVAA